MLVAEAERRGAMIDTSSKCTTIQNPSGVGCLDHDSDSISWVPNIVMGMVLPGEAAPTMELPRDITHMTYDQMVKTIFG